METFDFYISNLLISCMIDDVRISHHSLTHSLSLSLSLSIYLSISHHSLTHTHTHSLSLSLYLSLYQILLLLRRCTAPAVAVSLMIDRFDVVVFHWVHC